MIQIKFQFYHYVTYNEIFKIRPRWLYSDELYFWNIFLKPERCSFWIKLFGLEKNIPAS